MNQIPDGESAASTPEMLTIDEAAALLRVNPRTVQRAIAAGRIAHVRLSRQTVRIPRTALLEPAEPEGVEA